MVIESSVPDNCSSSTWTLSLAEISLSMMFLFSAFDLRILFVGTLAFRSNSRIRALRLSIGFCTLLALSFQEYEKALQPFGLSPFVTWLSLSV